MNAFKQLGLEDHLVQAITDLVLKPLVKYKKKQFPFY